MKILVLGSLFRQSDESELLKKSKIGLQNQVNTFQWALIKGFDSIQSNPTDILSVLPVGTYPKHYADLILKGKKWEHQPGAHDEEIWTVNLPFLKQNIRAILCRKAIQKWIKNNEHEELFIIILYSYLPFLMAIKNVPQNVKIILIVPDTKKIWTILFFAMLIIIIRSITAINAEMIFPGIARQSATGMFEDYPEFNLIGAGSYSFINGLVFLVLPILYVVRNKAHIISKIVLIIVGVLSLAAIIYTAWGTALILWGCALFIGLSPKKKQYIPLYVFVLLLALVVAISSGFVFQSGKTIFDDNPTIYDKIIDIQASIQEGEASGQVKGRQSLYFQSIDSFLSNPVLGDVNSEAGGHAFWFDHLARFGIVGTLPLLMAYFLLVLKSSRMASYNYRPYHYINAIILLLFGCVKNVVGYEFMLFLCIIGPLLTRLADSNITFKKMYFLNSASKDTNTHSRKRVLC